MANPEIRLPEHPVDEDDNNQTKAGKENPRYHHRELDYFVENMRLKLEYGASLLANLLLIICGAALAYTNDVVSFNQKLFLTMVFSAGGAVVIARLAYLLKYQK
jgi:hypothetical protein